MHALVLALAGFGFVMPAAATEQAAKAKSSNADGRVCYSEKTTGSNLRKRVCTNRAQRDQRRQEDQQAFERARRTTGAGGFGNKDP